MSLRAHVLAPPPRSAFVGPGPVSLLTLILALAPVGVPAADQSAPIVLVIHGGAGAPSGLSEEQQARYRATLALALAAGYRLLERGDSSLEAIVAAIVVLEDSPLFNAGRGAVFTQEGSNELDASLMDGRTLAAGAVAGVRHVANPILLAREVMQHSPHVMLAGAGAEEFALQRGMKLVPVEYFATPERWRELEHKRGQPFGISAAGHRHFGTVGAVALDRAGNLAAGTSTGGITAKRYGRVGDSPIIGAGTYADNASVAVSATGDGEYFIRAVASHDIAARVRYAGEPLAAATHSVIYEQIGRAGGSGGVIALDRDGNYALTFNTAGMFRGVIDSRRRALIGIYAELDPVELPER